MTVRRQSISPTVTNVWDVSEFSVTSTLCAHPSYLLNYGFNMATVVAFQVDHDSCPSIVLTAGPLTAAPSPVVIQVN